MSYSRLVEEKNPQRDSASDGGESHDFLLPQDRAYIADKHHTHARRGWYTRIAACAVACTAVFGIGIFAGTQLTDRNISCTRHVSQDSPLFNEVPMTYTVQRFNGSLFKENVFRQTASPEVDAAWASLGVNYNSVALPEKYALQAGFRTDQVKIKQKYGGGYPANVEGLHQLHCLNLVRQSLYYNYDYYKKEGKGAFINSDHVVKAHVSHCLDIIRQQLMCTIDVGFLGQVWKDPSYPTPFVDFNTAHKCRNFEAVRQWAEKHQLPSTDDIPDDFLEPPQPGDRIFEETP